MFEPRAQVMDKLQKQRGKKGKLKLRFLKKKKNFFLSTHSLVAEENTFTF
jgi:hypothetical protein